MAYKWSSFAVRVVVNSQIFLYNTYTDCILALSSEIDNLIGEHWQDVTTLQNLHPSLYDSLVDGKYVIDKQCVEWQEVLYGWEREDDSSHKFSITIIPTLNCNMRCWYCYEEHNDAAYMSDGTIQAIKKLISRKVDDQELKGLNIDFFGGEPFLHYKRCIQRILETAYAECIKREKQLYVSFTTNGYLLSEAMLKDLNKYAKWGRIRMQITLDGNEFLHDHTRVVGGIHPTYRRIVSNICSCAQQDIQLLVRFNYTDENINSFYDVIDDLKDLSPRARKNISFTLHKVWQVEGNRDLEESVESVRNAFFAKGFTVESTEPLCGTRCYGDRSNFVVINYNGDLYKCTARDFYPSCREGFLSSEGELVWNERYSKRMALRECPSVCHKCFLFPLCHAGCTQNKIETSTKTDECLMGYTDVQKRLLIEKKIEYKIRNIQTITRNHDK